VSNDLAAPRIGATTLAKLGEPPTLLVVTCAQDLCLTRNLLRRIHRLGAWRYFGGALLCLDADLSVGIARQVLLDEISLPADRIQLVRSRDFNLWYTNRPKAALAAYRLACSWQKDFVRLDPDLYIQSESFFPMITRPYPGIAGKQMQFFLPCLIEGRQLDFIQGGASYWGLEGRRYLENLSTDELQRFRSDSSAFVQTGPDHCNEYTYFFQNTEDVLITGVMAILNGVDRFHIPDLQVSPYDVLRGYRDPALTYEDYIEAYHRSGALAYHFEGSHDGRKSLMSKMLLRLYQEAHGDE
jgi:hypothetical protein